jgi:hypothetical protein
MFPNNRETVQFSFRALTVSYVEAVSIFKHKCNFHMSHITTSVKFKCKICIDEEHEAIKVIY